MKSDDSVTLLGIKIKKINFSSLSSSLFSKSF